VKIVNYSFQSCQVHTITYASIFNTRIVGFSHFENLVNELIAFLIPHACIPRYNFLTIHNCSFPLNAQVCTIFWPGSYIPFFNYKKNWRNAVQSWYKYPDLRCLRTNFVFPNNKKYAQLFLYFVGQSWHILLYKIEDRFIILTWIDGFFWNLF
jgi:hypothetical protein